MDEPLFIQKPLGDSVMSTIPFLLQDKKVKEIAMVRNLSEDTIESHTKLIRDGMHCSTIYGALVRMTALRKIKHEQLVATLPPGWDRYILPL
jgi:hypothetical protein